MKLDENFLKDIKKLIEIRNEIIHFKSVPITFNMVENADSLSIIQNDIQKINLDNMLIMPKKLDDLLMAQIFNIFPDLWRINEMMNTIFGHKYAFEFERR